MTVFRCWILSLTDQTSLNMFAAVGGQMKKLARVACHKVPKSKFGSLKSLRVGLFVLMSSVSVFGYVASAGAETSPESTPVPPKDLAERSGAWKKQASVIELWQFNGHSQWVLVCTIPIKNEAVSMKSNGYGCGNDNTHIFVLINAKLGNYGFYDDDCDEDGRFDDDYYKYRVTQAGIRVSGEFSIGNVHGMGNEVVPGMVYFEGNYKNGITPHLTCVNMWNIH
jgi:hypothetical protein